MFASLAFNLILPDVCVSLEISGGGEVSRGYFEGWTYGDGFGEGPDDQRGDLESERHVDSGSTTVVVRSKKLEIEADNLSHGCDVVSSGTGESAAHSLFSTLNLVISGS